MSLSLQTAFASAAHLPTKATPTPQATTNSATPTPQATTRTNVRPLLNVPGVQAYNDGPSVTICAGTVFIAYVDSNGAVNLTDPNGDELINRSPNFTLYTTNTPSIACYSGDTSYIPSSFPLNQSVDGAPSISCSGNTVWIAYVGTDSGHHLNFLSSTTNGSSWSSPTTMWNDNTRSGAGMSISYSPSDGVLWVTWIAGPGAAQPVFSIAIYNGTSTWQYKQVLSDYSYDRPGISGQGNSTVEFIWKAGAGGSTTVITGVYHQGNTNLNDNFHNSDQTIYAPAVQGKNTAYIGGDNGIKYNNNFF